MLNLLAKDIKLMFSFGKDIKRKTISMIVTFLFLALFAVIETYLYQAILGKIKNFSGAQVPFTALYLFIISILLMFYDLMAAKRLFFDGDDGRYLSTYPVEGSQIIFSKLIIIFLTSYLFSLAFAYPIIVSYGINNSRLPIFYFLGLFYPLLTTFFEIGVSLILLFPVKFISDFLKRHQLIQFILGMAVMGGLAFAYAKVVDLFVALLSGDSLSSLFNSTNMATLSYWKKFFVVSNYAVDILFSNRMSSFLPLLLFSLGALMIGLTLTLVFYPKMRESLVKASPKGRKKAYKQVSETHALLNKELDLLFRNRDSLFGYAGLLLSSPYLLYTVLFAMHKAFSSGMLGYYLALIPSFDMAIDILFYLFFVLILAGGASDYIGREGNSLKMMKTMPIAPKKQLWVKILIPFLLSSLSSLVSALLLLFMLKLDAMLVLSMFVVGELALLSYNLIAMMEELKRSKTKGNSSFGSSVYSYSFPIVCFVIAFLVCFLQIGNLWAYIAILALGTVSLLPSLFVYLRKEDRLFADMEVSS